ncbi:unnamed protein product, partial [Arabidopsis halleri]
MLSFVSDLDSWWWIWSKWRRVCSPADLGQFFFAGRLSPVVGGFGEFGDVSSASVWLAWSGSGVFRGIRCPFPPPADAVASSVVSYNSDVGVAAPSSLRCSGGSNCVGVRTIWLNPVKGRRWSRHGVFTQLNHQFGSCRCGGSPWKTVGFASELVIRRDPPDLVGLRGALVFVRWIEP